MFVEAQVVLSESRVSLLVHPIHAAAVAVRWFGALSLGRVLLQFSANSRVVGRIRNQKDPYFCGPGQISGPSACLPSSANSSARSLRRQPVWLLTFTRVNLPDHWRSSCKSGRITAKCTISLGLGWKSLRPHFLRISRTTRQSTNISR